MAVSIFVESASASHPGPQTDRRPWLQPIGCGLLLGASIALLEFAYYYPFVSSPDRLGFASLAVQLLSWCGEGVLLALTVAFFERFEARWLPGGWQLALAVAIGSIAGVLAWQAFVHFVLRDRFGIWLFRDHVGQPVNLTGSILYHVWLMFVFGGLAVAVYISLQRHARMLAVLRAADLSRESSQRRLAEERLGALRARIDPEFILQTLTKLERLYESDPAGADRVLEELIVFLRMPLGDAPASATQAPTSDAAIQATQHILNDA